jgi:tRNA A-37 threonylcarbamoyl transferase component Bud32
MCETQTIVRGGRSWWIRPESAAPLLEGPWPLEHPDRLTVVKRGNRRAVARLELPAGAAFYAKIYEGGGLLRRLISALGLGPGRREWNALLAAREAGLDVPEPVALSRGGPEMLLTREIPGARRLDEFLFERYFEPLPGDPPYPGARPPELVAIYRRRRTPPQGSPTPRDLACGLADLVTRLAAADLYLPDLHPGNILISGSPGAWRLSVVDLPEPEPPAPAEAVLDHLVQLEHFFEPIASASERRRCLVCLAKRTDGVPDARQVARAAAAYRLRFYRRRDGRTRRESKYFRRVAAGDWTGWTTADWAESATRLLELYGAGPFPEAQVVKNGRTATVWRVTLDGTRTLYIKRHNLAGANALARSGLRRSRSITALRRGHALLARGIATARPAAALDCHRAGTVRDTLLATEPVEGVELGAWLRQNPAPAARRHLSWLLARMIRRLHDAGFTHRDLKARNILVAPASGPDARPVLVDLDGVRGPRHVSARRRARDLMRLGVSLEEFGVGRRSDRLRFLKTYLGSCGCPGEITVAGRARGSKRGARRVRRWWRRIARLSLRKIEALRRKGTFPA